MESTLATRQPAIQQIVNEKGGTFRLRYTETQKPNDVVLSGFSIIRDTSENARSISPIVYATETDSDEDIAERILSVSNSPQRTIPDNVIDRIYDREFVLSHVVPRLLNERNIKMLEQRGVIYERYADDLVVAYTVMLDDTGESTMNTYLTASLCGAAGITADEAQEAAIRNIEFDFTIRSLFETLCDLTEEDMPKDMLDYMGGPPLYVLTNHRRMFGAAAILSLSARKTAVKKLGGSAYVIPSSLHDVLLVPVDAVPMPGDLCSVIGEVNEKCVDASEILSYHPYLLREDLSVVSI